jgi:hypothetical protein
MKYMLSVLAVMLLAIAGCGHDHDDNGGHSHDGDDHHHTHEGTRHGMGSQDLGDGYHVQAAHVGKVEAGKEGVFEIVVKLNDEGIKDASVIAWIGDKDGKELIAPEQVAWSNDEKLYDGHLHMPDTLPEGARLWVKVRHKGHEKSCHFSLEGHDHD